jgi:polar amino acid transport system substrate-binding protein
VDLVTAIADLMGVKAVVSNQPFDSIIPGLAAGKYNLGMSSFTDTKEREMTVDFVTYATAGESFFVNSDGGPTINSIDDLCGHKVGAEKGTTEADDATAQSKKCTDAGKPGVSVSVFPDENGVNLALSSGRVDVGFADTPVADYAVKQSDGKFKLSPAPSIANAPYGIAMAKDSGLQQPVLAAVKALMADGTYKQILDYWGLQSIAISNPTINGAID